MAWWIVAYIVSVMFILFLAGLAATHEGSTTIVRWDFMVTFGLICIWPISLTMILPYLAIMDRRNASLETAAKEAMKRVQLQRPHETIVGMQESELKDALKAYRKNLVKMDDKVLAAIRQELTNRVAERHLLK